jgi:hypothetical protein
VTSKRPRTSWRQSPPDLATRVSFVKAPPTPQQARAWRRQWQLLLQDDPATLALDEPPLDVADESGSRKHVDDQA